ncbi:unnamed protein product [Parnassius apollo]|uniref:(apollo) hypothetical protein n=1 Tax=Parnassius apollo TaxID=110799 RepID=A0A8S3X211_PARAO|nr:unnamed protein product [Parnassius apollo]
MFSRKSKQSHSGNFTPKPESLPDIALAAIVSYKKQKDINDFISFILEALERNADWLNDLVGKQNSFRCALMTGSGPNRFQIQQIIYPSSENEVKFQIECKDSEDYDKVAIAALIKLNNANMERMMKYTKSRFFENSLIKEELIKGKMLGINYAVLRSLSDKQYRLFERIVIGSSSKCISPVKRRLEDKSMTRNPLKRVKKLAY